jgi:hypothetical protein
MLPDANPFGWRFAFLDPVSSHLLEEIEICAEFLLLMQELSWWNKL